MSRNYVRSLALNKVMVGDNRRYDPPPVYAVPQIGPGKMTFLIFLLAGMVIHRLPLCLVPYPLLFSELSDFSDLYRTKRTSEHES